MDKTSFKKWQALQDEFLNSDLGEAEFCKSKKLALEWFRQQMREAEIYEKQSGNLFVELISQVKTSTPQASIGCLKIRFREVDFELTDEFPVEIFRQALQVVKEVV